MLTKVIFGVFAMALMATYVGAIVLKLMDPALAVVVLIGLAMMGYDFFESLREPD